MCKQRYYQLNENDIGVHRVRESSLRIEYPFSSLEKVKFECCKFTLIVMTARQLPLFLLHSPFSPLSPAFTSLSTPYATVSNVS